MKTSLNTIVEKAFIFEPQCYQHCNSKASFTRFVDRDDAIMGAYICPENFVSRIVYFAAKPNLRWFKKELENIMTKRSILEERDIRIATRHQWEIDKSAIPTRKKLVQHTRPEGLAPYVVREVYWVYPRQKMLDENEGAFRCSNCGKIFVQPLATKNSVCENCV